MFLEKCREINPEIEEYSDDQLKNLITMIDSESRTIKNIFNTILSDIGIKSRMMSENIEKIRQNKHLPYLVGQVIEIFDDDGTTCGNGVVCSSTRQSNYLDMLGLVDKKGLKPGDPVALHKETKIIFEKLPTSFDSKVKSMELKDKPNETYEDIGGLERQIEDLNEGIVLPLIYPERFKKLNIQAPKGVLMYGPPGTGKTLMARACAAKTNATFLKLAGPQLVQMYIGDGARLLRETFALAREKAPSIIFIDEIDAIGMKRSDSDKTGDREVQRTMLELLNELDGFSSSENIKVIAATNRVDILDPALLRSGRLDRKIEFPLPNHEGRKRIMQIHARKMAVDDAVNFDDLAKSTEGFNGAQCKAVCTEAGMSAVRLKKTIISQGDFINGINEVLSRKKSNLIYFT